MIHLVSFERTILSLRVVGNEEKQRSAMQPPLKPELSIRDIVNTRAEKLPITHRQKSHAVRKFAFGEVAKIIGRYNSVIVLIR